MMANDDRSHEFVREQLDTGDIQEPQYNPYGGEQSLRAALRIANSLMPGSVINYSLGQPAEKEKFTGLPFYQSETRQYPEGTQKEYSANPFQMALDKIRSYGANKPYIASPGDTLALRHLVQNLQGTTTPQDIERPRADITPKIPTATTPYYPAPSTPSFASIPRENIPEEWWDTEKGPIKTSHPYGSMSIEGSTAQRGARKISDVANVLEEGKLHSQAIRDMLLRMNDKSKLVISRDEDFIPLPPYRPHKFADGGPVDDRSHEFVREQLDTGEPQVRQYDPEAGNETLKKALQIAAGVTTPGAVADFAGYLGGPSALENFRNRNYGSAALQAASIIPGVGPFSKAARIAEEARVAERAAQPIRAYHYSPVAFERFEPGHAGTGAGGTSFGHGTGYFGAKEDDARMWQRRINEERGLPKDTGHMYEVELNADPERMIDYNKYLHEQPEAVKDILINKLGYEPRMFEKPIEGSFGGGKPRGDMAVPQSEGARKAWYEAGIHGAKYYDPGNSYSGYVTFSDEPATILRRYADGGSADDRSEAPYGVVDLGDKIIVGAPHGQQVELSDELKRRVQDVAKRHGAWYEGAGGDVEPNRGLVPNYHGSWDDAYSSSVKGYPIEYLSPMFSNVDVNKPHEVFEDPKRTIMASLIANQDKMKYFKDRRYDEKALRDFLQQGSEGDVDFLKMSQLPATKENLNKFFRTGESLAWPENWQEYPHNLGKMAKKTEEGRNKYLLDAPPGVYFTGAGHIPELRSMKKDLKVIGGERSAYDDGGTVDDLPLMARQSPDDEIRDALRVATNISEKKQSRPPVSSEIFPVTADDKGLHLDWNAGVTGKVKRAGQYFADTMSGKKPMDVTSPEAIEAANTIAGAVGGAGYGFGSKPAGSLGMFLGEKAHLSPAERFQMRNATDMIAAQKDRDAILKNTGWLQGPAGEMKTELSDINSTVNPDALKYNRIVKGFDPETGKMKTARLPPETTLHQILQHPDLYSKYPHLQDIPVAVDPETARGSAFYRLPSATEKYGRMGLHPELLSNPEALREALLHETGHAIQNFEGWPGGGSPSDPKLAKIPKGTNPISRTYNKLMGNYYDPHVAYGNLAGELEAYNIGSRRDLPQDVLRDFGPWNSQFNVMGKQHNPHPNEVLIKRAGDAEILPSDMFRKQYNFADGGKIERKTYEPIHGLKITPPAEELSEEPDIRDYQLKRHAHEFEGAEEPVVPRRPVVLDAPLFGGKHKLGTLPYNYAPAVEKALNLAYGQKTLPLYFNRMTAPLGMALDAYEASKFVNRDPKDLKNYTGVPGLLFAAGRKTLPFIGAGAGAGSLVAKDHPEEEAAERADGGSLPMRLPYGQRYNRKSDRLDAPDAKGIGFLGPLSQGDHIVSEYSSDRDIQYPSVYEGISPVDLGSVLMHEKLSRPKYEGDDIISERLNKAQKRIPFPRDIDERAYRAAQRRVKEGKSPFFEQGKDKYPSWTPDQYWEKPAIMPDREEPLMYSTGGAMKDDSIDNALRLAKSGNTLYKSERPQIDHEAAAHKLLADVDNLLSDIRGREDRSYGGDVASNDQCMEDFGSAGMAGGGIANNAAKKLIAEIDELIPHMKKGGKLEAEPEPGSDAYWAQKDKTYAKPYEDRLNDPKDPMRYISPKEYQRGRMGYGEYVMADGGRVGYSEGGAPTDLNPTGNPVVSANQPIPDQDPTRNYVQSLYKNVMGREGEQGGVDYWTNQLQQGSIDQPGALQNFAQSAEFQNLYQTDPSKAVSSLYQTALGRAPEQAGLDYWTQQAKSGLGLGDMVSGFTGSQEGQDVQAINQYYQDLTGNVATPEQIQQAQQQLGPNHEWDSFLEKTFPNQQQDDGSYQVASNNKVFDFLKSKGLTVGDIVNQPLSQGAKDFLGFIASGEGGYNSMNQGAKSLNSPVIGSTNNASTVIGRNLPEMTIDEIMKLQALPYGNKDRIFTAGRYQLNPKAMEYAVKVSGIDRNSKFDEATQDKLGLALALTKQPQLGVYLLGLNNNVKSAGRAASREWASVINPYTGRSYYPGKANKARGTVAELINALQSARGNIIGDIQLANSTSDQPKPDRIDPGVLSHSGSDTAPPTNPQFNQIDPFFAPYTPQEIRDQMGSNQAISDSVVSPGGVVYNQPHTTHTTHTSPATHVSPVTHTGGGGSHVTNHGSGSVSFGPAEPSGVAGTGIDYGISSSVHHTSAADPYFGHGHNMHFNPQTGQWMDAAMARNLDPAYDMARGGIVRASGGAVKPDNEDVENALRIAKRKSGGRKVNAKIDKDPAFDMSLKSGGGAWTRKEGQNPEGGLNAKGRASAKAEGHDLKPPAPHPKTDKDAARRKSFCLRMKGMKEKQTSSEVANDPDSRINKSLRVWNCHDTGGVVRDALRVASGGEIWDKKRPKSLGEPEALSSSQKKSAKASAKAAGRPYPSLVDNMRAAQRKK